MSATIENRLSFREQLAYFLSRSRGVRIETDLRPYLAIAEEIQAFDYSGLRDADLQKLGRDIRSRAQGGQPLESLLPMTFAAIREVSRRTIGLAPFDVQVLAGIVLHKGRLAEMQTGEGKTLAAVFPAVLNALTGRGVHVMTANDYLARRDAEWMGPIYRFLGLRVGYVQERMPAGRRKRAYRADVTYLTAKEAGFDLLRDQLRYSPDEIVQREYHYAIVDEADFILIDQARVPLVIAGHAPRPEVDPRLIEGIVPELRRGEDFQIDRNRRSVFLSLEGQKKVERLLHCGGIHEAEYLQTYAAVNVALHAHHLLSRDVDYIVRRGRIELVDELTGRVADRRRWPYGIQAALEAKEGLEIQPEGIVYGSVTIQHFVDLYPRIAAMTATAVSAAPELAGFYGLDTVVIPPHKRVIRVDAQDRVYATVAAKTGAVLEEIATAHRAGRPVLVGTRSVKESQSLADLLRAQGIACQVLNAKNDRHEARLVARAGAPGAVTISTNMAGRGTDIKLGGEQGVERETVERLGGLYVIGTNRHESRRIDRQLRGRAGRQGDPGQSCFFVSLEDPLFELYGAKELIPARYLRGGNSREICDPLVSREIARAQSIIANQHYEMRRTLRRYSELVERQRRRMQAVRAQALQERRVPDQLWQACRPGFEELAGAAGEDAARDLLVRVFLSAMDRFWADHLLYVDELRDGVHLQRLGGEDPLQYFIREVSEAFAEGMEAAGRRAAERFSRVRAGSGGSVLMEEEGLNGPSATWTYLINDDPLPGFNLGALALGNVGAAAAAAISALPLLVAAPFVALFFLIRRLRRRSRTGRE
jgi:preprotein translocase subunit SecA